MGIFGNKKSTKKSADTAEGKVKEEGMTAGKNLSGVILKPRITEKAMLGNDRNVYAFEIARTATKYDVRDAVKAIFKVTPVKVHVVVKQPRQYMSRARGRKMLSPGMKKAYVYLKKGDKIDLV